MFESPEPVGILRRRIPTAIASLLAIGLLAAACGADATEDTAGVAALPSDSEESAASATDEDGGSTDGGDTEVSEEDAETAQLKFDQCMTDNGVDQDELFGDLDDGDGEGGAITFEVDGSDGDFDEKFEAYEAALEECEPILEAVFGDFELSPEQEAEFADAEAKFNQCMADAGFPTVAPGDGEQSGDGQGFSIDGDVDIDELQEAADTCGEVYEDLGSFESTEGADQ